MGTIVIGIGGKKEVGKDTSARILVEKYGFQRFAFADALKEVCADAFDMNIYDLHDPIKKETKFMMPFIVDEVNAKNLVDALREFHPVNNVQEYNVIRAINGMAFATPRQLLQYVGTDVVRKKVSDTFWLDVLSNQIKGNDRVVITDMRFKNERDMVKKQLKGKLLLIKREKEEDTGNHPSENSLGKPREYDAVIENSGSTDDLIDEVERFYKCLVKKRKYQQYHQSPLARLVNFLGIGS